MDIPELRLGDASDFVALRMLKYETYVGQSEPDIRLGVSVRADDFTGEYDQVWIARQDWVHFIVHLNRLERERIGEAALYAMSPEEFELRLKIVTPKGDLAACGFLSKRQLRGHGEWVKSRVEYWFDLDPSMLREWVDRFESFGPEPVVTS